jgi:glucose-1-phosphate thymidylyltransferase
MIYYPLATLMFAGIRDVLIISTPEDTPKFEAILGNGQRLGMSFSYRIQEKPEGIAQAFIIGAEFIGLEPCCLILGDNLFYGHGLPELLNNAGQLTEGAIVFGYRVKDPERYGVVEFDDQGNVSASKKNRNGQNRIMPYPGSIFTITRWLRLPKASNLQAAANWRSPI